jgi:hypothetical protein
VLDVRGVRRRIPLAAIERVEVRGPKGRCLTVLLTVTDGGDPQSYALVCRSAAAVAEFARVVGAALPVRDAAEPRPDGAGMVVVKPLERPAPDLVRRRWWALGAAYTLVLAALLLTGPEVAPVVFWLVSPAVIPPGWLAARAGWRLAREAWVLRTRGITVEGRLKSSAVIDTDNGLVSSYVYEYVDLHGVRRECSGSSGDGAKRVEIVYDPEDPESDKIGRGTAGQLVFGVVVGGVLGAPMLALGAVFVAVAVGSLFV